MCIWMRTLGSLHGHGLTAACVLLTFATLTQAQMTRTGAATAVRAGQTICPTVAREKELFDAIKQKDSARVGELLTAGVDPNARSVINYESWESTRPSCATALMHAARLGDARVVRSLLAAKADANAVDSWGRHAWAYAFGMHTILLIPPARLQDEMNARLDITGALLEADAQPDAQDQDKTEYPYWWGETALFHAAAAGVMTGDLRILQRVIASGATVKDNAVLAYATSIAQSGFWNERGAPGAAQVVKLLLAAGANVNSKGNSGTSLMMEAYGWRFEGAAQRVKVLLAAGADVNAQSVGTGDMALLNVLRNRNGQYQQPTAMEQAGAAAWAEIVKLLLDAGADPNRSDKQGDSPLPASFNMSWAAHFPSESEAVFKALVAAGADLNSRDRYGATILSHVVVEAFVYSNGGQLDRAHMLRALIAAGADVNAPNKENQTPLLLAAKSGAGSVEEVFRILIGARADVNLADNGGETPLMATLTSGRYYNNPQETAKLVRLLLEAKANVNAKNRAGDTALALALKAGVKVDIVGTLLSAGADVNLANGSGEPALTVAVRAHREEEVIRALLAAGARVDFTSDSGDTALIVAAKEYDRRQVVGDARRAEMLVAAGANVRHLNNEGESALTVMSMKAGADDLPFIRALLPAGERSRAVGYPRDVDLLVAIRRAGGSSSADVVQELIAAGADVNATDELGRPALLIAAGESGNPTVVRALLVAGARVNAEGKEGDTALTAAMREYLPGEDELIKNALRRNPEVIRTLLDAGADPNKRGKGGSSALELARRSGNKILIGMLEGAARR